jgi:hypothetical protein
MSSTGKHLALSRADDLTLVEVDTGTPLLEVPGPVGPFAFDETGSHLMFLRGDGSLGRADIASREVTSLGPMLTPQAGKAYSDATQLFVANGRVVVQTGTEIVSADTSTGKRLARRPLLRDMEIGFPTALSPSGRWMAGYSDVNAYELLILDDKLGTVRSIPFQKSGTLFIHSLAFDGDDAVIITFSALNGREGGIVRVSIPEGAVRARRVGPIADTVCDRLQMPPSGPYLFCSHAPHRSGAARLQWLARDTLAVVRTQSYEGRSTLDAPGLYVDNAQERLFVGADAPVVALGNGRPVGNVWLGPSPSTFALKETRALEVRDDGAPRSQGPRSTFVGNDEPLNCPGSALRTAPFVCARGGKAFARIDGSVVHYALSSQAQLRRLTAPWAPSALALRQDGAQVALRNEAGAAIVFDLESGAVVGTVAAPRHPDADAKGSIAFLGDVLMIAGRPGRLVKVPGNGREATETVEVHHVPGLASADASLAFVGDGYAWGDERALSRVGLRATGPGPAVSASRLRRATPAEQAQWLVAPKPAAPAADLFVEAARFAAGGGKSVYDERAGDFRVFAFERGTSRFVASPWGAEPLPPGTLLVRPPAGTASARYALLRDGDHLYFAFQGHRGLVINKFTDDEDRLGGVRYAVVPGFETWGPLPIIKYAGASRGREIALVPSELPSTPPGRKHHKVPLLAQGTWPETGPVAGGQTGHCKVHLSTDHPSDINTVEFDLVAGRMGTFRAYSMAMADEWGAVPFDFPYVGAAMRAGSWVSVGAPYRDGVKRFRLKYDGQTLLVEGHKDRGQCTFEAPGKP